MYLVSFSAITNSFMGDGSEHFLSPEAPTHRRCSGSPCPGSPIECIFWCCFIGGSRCGFGWHSGSTRCFPWSDRRPGIDLEPRVGRPGIATPPGF
ncbi:hypothetical protein MTO96_024349 [Rhipicephalus appendiculatus]